MSYLGSVSKDLLWYDKLAYPKEQLRMRFYRGHRLATHEHTKSELGVPRF